LLGLPAGAEDFDWHSLANQKQMHGAFANTADVCAATFGFTRITPTPNRTMADQLDAYLLLRDDADGEVERWAVDILRPVNGMLAKKSTGANAEDEHSAAAAAVAAAEDPNTYAEAQARYLEGAMAPFRRALNACSAGANDPFLGKYYWTGSGSADGVELTMKNFFAELVAGLKKPKPR
jgi:hypothetical protein